MTWTPEQIEQIPDVYRDFLLALKPVVDSRQPEAVLKVTGIPYGRIFEYMRTRYGLEAHEIREVSDTLRKRDLVDEDKLGFLIPTGPGEQLIDALAEEREEAPSRVPPFPDF